MFTWECPTCGREIDIAESECPHCSKKAKATSTAVATESPAAAGKRPEGQGAAAAPHLPPAQRAAAPRRQPAPSWGLQGKQIAVFAVLAVIAIVAAVFFARPDLFRGAQQTEETALPEGAGESGSAYLGDIEVAGVRTWYDPDFKPKVSAVVVNHSESPQANVSFKVDLRTRDASTTDTPLASFEIRLDTPMAAREARDVQADLTAMGTLASLPPWHQMRVDLQRQ